MCVCVYVDIFGQSGCLSIPGLGKQRKNNVCCGRKRGICTRKGGWGGIVWLESTQQGIGYRSGKSPSLKHSLHVFWHDQIEATCSLVLHDTIAADDERWRRVKHKKVKRYYNFLSFSWFFILVVFLPRWCVCVCVSSVGWLCYFHQPRNSQYWPNWSGKSHASVWITLRFF